MLLAKLLSMIETYIGEMYKSRLPLAVWIMHDFGPGKYPIILLLKTYAGSQFSFPNVQSARLEVTVYSSFAYKMCKI